MCVISPRYSAGMVRIMRCHIVKLSIAPDDMFAQGELKLFQMDRLALLYNVQELLRQKEILSACRT